MLNLETCKQCYNNHGLTWNPQGMLGDILISKRMACPFMVVADFARKHQQESINYVIPINEIPNHCPYPDDHF